MTDPRECPVCGEIGAARSEDGRPPIGVDFLCDSDDCHVWGFQAGGNSAEADQWRWDRLEVPIENGV